MPVYSVKEVCAMIGVSRKTLFYYDRIHLLEPLRRDGKLQYKKYGDEEIIRLKEIIQYRKAVLQIIEIRSLLDDPEADPLMILKQALSRMKKDADVMQEQMNRIKELIEEYE